MEPKWSNVPMEFFRKLQPDFTSGQIQYKMGRTSFKGQINSELKFKTNH